jgi:hypothetical protein
MRFKVESVVNELAKKYGGKWIYDRRSGTWECDDGIKYVCKILTGVDMDGEYTGESSLCLYCCGDVAPPEWVWL